MMQKKHLYSSTFLTLLFFFFTGHVVFAATNNRGFFKGKFKKAKSFMKEGKRFLGEKVKSKLKKNKKQDGVVGGSNTSYQLLSVDNPAITSSLGKNNLNDTKKKKVPEIPKKQPKKVDTNKINQDPNVQENSVLVALTTSNNDNQVVRNVEEEPTKLDISNILQSPNLQKDKSKKTFKKQSEVVDTLDLLLDDSNNEDQVIPSAQEALQEANTNSISNRLENNHHLANKIEDACNNNNEQGNQILESAEKQPEKTFKQGVKGAAKKIAKKFNPFNKNSNNDGQKKKKKKGVFNAVGGLANKLDRFMDEAWKSFAIDKENVTPIVIRSGGNTGLKGKEMSSAEQLKGAIKNFHGLMELLKTELEEPKRNAILKNLDKSTGNIAKLTGDVKIITKALVKDVKKMQKESNDLTFFSTTNDILVGIKDFVEAFKNNEDQDSDQKIAVISNLKDAVHDMARIMNMLAEDDINKKGENLNIIASAKKASYNLATLAEQLALDKDPKTGKIIIVQDVKDITAEAKKFMDKLKGIKTDKKGNAIMVTNAESILDKLDNFLNDKRMEKVANTIDNAKDITDKLNHEILNKKGIGKINATMTNSRNITHKVNHHILHKKGIKNINTTINNAKGITNKINHKVLNKQGIKNINVTINNAKNITDKLNHKILNKKRIKKMNTTINNANDITDKVNHKILHEEGIGKINATMTNARNITHKVNHHILHKKGIKKMNTTINNANDITDKVNHKILDKKGIKNINATINNSKDITHKVNDEILNEEFIKNFQESVADFKSMLNEVKVKKTVEKYDDLAKNLNELLSLGKKELRSVTDKLEQKADSAGKLVKDEVVATATSVQIFLLTASALMGIKGLDMFCKINKQTEEKKPEKRVRRIIR